MQQAVVIMWNGNILPDYLIMKIGEILTTNGICAPEALSITYKDQDGVATSLLRDVKVGEMNIPARNAENEAVKQAVIYIGERFEVSLKDTSKDSMVSFALALANAVNSERLNTIAGIESPLLNALKILSTTTAVIPVSLAKKYHFNQGVVSLIKKVYESSLLLYVSRL